MKTIKGTKEQIKALNNFVTEVTLSDKPVPVTNELEHQAALQLIAAGHAVATKKKNYGRIAEIKGL